MNLYKYTQPVGEQQPNGFKLIEKITRYRFAISTGDVQYWLDLKYGVQRQPAKIEQVEHDDDVLVAYYYKVKGVEVKA
jgi:hypothetical protein